MLKTRLHSFEFNKTDPQTVFMASQQGMYTYRDLDRYTAYFKSKIEEKEASLKGPVAFLSESSDALIFSIAACWKLGIPFIPLSPKLDDDELNDYLEELDPVLTFCDANNRRRVGEEDGVQIDENFFLSAFTFDVRNIDLSEFEELDEEKTFGYFFTSGTTGKPKIVSLKRRQMMVAAEASARNFRPEPNHFWLLCLPLNHVGGISIILRSLIYGSAIYRLSDFKEEMIKEFVGENPRFQAASFVPTMLKRLLDDPLFKTHREFQGVLLGGGPVSETLLRKSVERGIPIVSSYGMTETCAQIIANPLLAPSGMYTPFKSVGKPFPPNELQIRDEDGFELGKNQSGEIWLRGPQVIDSYFREKDNTGRFDNEGWFKTGDYGHLNGFGQLFIESRRTDLIVTGGENVNPVEVEEALEKLPEIREAAVIGLPDEEWGQKVTAIVTLTNGTTPDLNTVRDQLKNKLMDFKVPKMLKVVSELPKTATGKVRKADLAELFK
ncbi:o-succinylbenzoate--CoA ligase [Balneola sp. MJW-20]|uniref:o-succinylbenzoate--CoA ligase n=1 Tax=Gracilimonas aurantiaca TaxID=3234185 RepID=UPI003466F17E